MKRRTQAGNDFRNGFSDGSWGLGTTRHDTARKPSVFLAFMTDQLRRQQPSTTDGGLRLPLPVAAPQNAARPMHAPIRGTSMIDQHGKTDLLIARLKEALPIEESIRIRGGCPGD